MTSLLFQLPVVTSQDIEREIGYFFAECFVSTNDKERGIIILLISPDLACCIATETLWSLWAPMSMSQKCRMYLAYAVETDICISTRLTTRNLKSLDKIQACRERDFEEISPSRDCGALFDISRYLNHSRLLDCPFIWLSDPTCFSLSPPSPPLLWMIE